MWLTLRKFESGDSVGFKSGDSVGESGGDPSSPQVLPEYCVVAPSNNGNVQSEAKSVRSQDVRDFLAREVRLAELQKERKRRRKVLDDQRLANRNYCMAFDTALRRCRHEGLAYLCA